jgi:hypothetical protein
MVQVFIHHPLLLKLLNKDKEFHLIKMKEFMLEIQEQVKLEQYLVNLIC